MSDELTIDDGATRDDVASKPKGHQRLGLALVLISIAQLMVVLDATIANIALPFIGKDLDITGTNLTWIVTGYSLVFGGLLLLGGRLADLYGRRRIFMIGLVVFAVASPNDPIAAMRSPRMPMSARYQGLPVPSSTRPFLIRMSNDCGVCAESVKAPARIAIASVRMCAL